MSDKRMNEIGRRQRFRRRLRGEDKAVSPVVATLILILIAVAAAAALYLWLVAWQGGVTSTVGSPSPQYTVTIGGSTSVYPFAEQAATWFDANNSDVSISVNQGGSGAGMAAVCSGQVDIGEASTFYGTGAQPAATPGAIQTSYGCPSTVSVEVIAYDGVDLITPLLDTHGLNSMTWDTAQGIYFSAATLLPGDTGYAGSNIYANGNYHMDTVLAPVQPAQGTSYLWDQIPACAAAATTCATNGPEALVTPTADATAGTITVGGGANALTAGVSNAEAATATFTAPTGWSYASGVTSATLTEGGTTPTEASIAGTAGFSNPTAGVSGGPYSGVGSATFANGAANFAWGVGDTITIPAGDAQVSGTGCAASPESPTTVALTETGTTLTAGNEVVSFSYVFTGGMGGCPAFGGITAGQAALTDFSLATTTPTASGYAITSQQAPGASPVVSFSYAVTGAQLSGETATISAPLISYYQLGAGTACGTNDICAASGGTISPCGFNTCASGTNSIDVYSRSDVSGTQQSFGSRLLAIGASGGTPQGIGFTGCPTGDNQWDACNVAMPSKYAENGNPAVIAAVAGDANGLGFASDGLAQATGTVLPVNFQGYGQTVVVSIVGESTALTAIAKGIADHESNANTYSSDQAYVGWRPFLNVETAPPTGESLRYLQWVMDPANNEAVAAATYEISVYASGLAGHVPVTPIP